MARIRSIKPEFWTSEQIAECSPNVRLLFIGMWNFCDDYGVHPASEMRLKMEVFPSDSFSKDDIRRMIDELLANGLLTEYEVSGTQYWWVTGWDKHQKPDCKTGLYPRPDGSVGTKIRRTVSEDSPNVRGTFAQGEGEGKVKGEGKKESADKKHSAISLKTFLDSLNGERAIAEDDPIFTYCEKCGISEEMLNLCWLKFKDYYLETPSKKYKDWRKTFRNCVKDNWYGIWWFNADNKAELSNKGRQAAVSFKEAA